MGQKSSSHVVINASVMAGIMWKRSGIAMQLNLKLVFDRAENKEIQNRLILNLFSDGLCICHETRLEIYEISRVLNVQY
jgi:hypothetical protein